MFTAVAPAERRVSARRGRAGEIEGLFEHSARGLCAVAAQEGLIQTRFELAVLDHTGPLILFIGTGIPQGAAALYSPNCGGAQLPSSIR
jgi:hypothetical protein